MLPPQPVKAVGVTPASCSIDKMATNTLLISLPVYDLKCVRCDRPLATVGMAVKHFKVVHPAEKVIYVCQKCGRTSVNSHSISCHVPKCKGVTETAKESDDDHICGKCLRRFRTAVGLTQHKRHKHIELYCKEKEGELTANGKGMNVATEIWSEKEESILVEMCKELAGNQQINGIIAITLGKGKTAEQVRRKRRRMRLGKMREGSSKEAYDGRGPVVMLSKPGIPLTPHSDLRRILRDELNGNVTKNGVEIGEVLLSLRGGSKTQHCSIRPPLSCNGCCAGDPAPRNRLTH